MRRVPFIAALLLPALAAAHETLPSDRLLLQLRADATELLYELTIPPGPDAGRWRLIADANRDGLLSDSEMQGLARVLAERIASQVRLRIVGGERLPFTVLDAKVADVVAPDGLSGRLSAIALLSARAVPEGTHRLELDVEPIAHPSRPALVRLEFDEVSLKAIVGGSPAKMADGSSGVLVRRGQPVTLTVERPAREERRGAPERIQSGASHRAGGPARRNAARPAAPDAGTR